MTVSESTSYAINRDTMIVLCYCVLFNKIFCVVYHVPEWFSNIREVIYVCTYKVVDIIMAAWRYDTMGLTNITF